MATLKISELSVGDWVMCNEDKYRVMGITMFHELDLLKSSESFRTSIDNIEPIPITAEILEKNGFTPNEYSNKIWSFIAERELIQYFFVNHKLCIRNRNAVDVDVLHIHELQHALRLAGFDKEINL